MKHLLTAAALGLLSLTQMAWAGTSEKVVRLQNEWAEAMYHNQGDAKENKLEALAQESRTAASATPNDPDVLIWEGIILSSYAGAKGGLGALGLVSEAKEAFEKALSINPKAMDGSAYTSLGSLYYQVPGWPIGFGDDEKAEELLKKGLEINPTGIDPNYFYGDYLLRQGRYAEAEKALLKAKEAPPRPSRPLADEGRQGEIEMLIQEVRRHKG